MKTPEQMAEEYAELMSFDVRGHQRGFLAGYQAAKDEDKAKMQELKANWKFCCEDKATLLNELAAAERAKDQLADADKVMPQWISVKDRLPDIYQRVFILIRGRVFISSWDGDWDWPEVTHWMPLPIAPKEEK